MAMWKKNTFIFFQPVSMCVQFSLVNNRKRKTPLPMYNNDDDDGGKWLKSSLSLFKLKVYEKKK